MPYTERQNRVWRAIEHGWRPPSGKFEGVSAEEAGKMAEEGIERSVTRARRKHRTDRSMRREE